MLVEPSAHLGGGHWGENLARLCQHEVHDLTTSVVVHGGLHHDIDALIRGAADHVATDPAAASRIDGALDRMARSLEQLTRWLRNRYPGRWLADQPALIARLLDEVVCLRSARAMTTRSDDVIVVLTANEVLHTVARALSRTPHLRFVHEHSTRHARVLGTLDGLAARLVPPPLVLCPTEAVQGLVRDETPHVPTRVQTFAVSGTLATLDPDARRRTRAALDLPTDRPAVALLGSWWPYKDHEVVAQAIEQLDTELVVVLIGGHTDAEVVARLRQRLGPGLVELGASVPPVRYSQVCTAVDAILISRRPGVGKESGLLMDAVRHRTPVIMSDNDPQLVERIGSRPWVHLFATGDASSLRTRLAELVPLSSSAGPGPADEATLGMLSPTRAVSAFAELSALHHQVR